MCALGVWVCEWWLLGCLSGQVNTRRDICAFRSRYGWWRGGHRVGGAAIGAFVTAARGRESPNVRSKQCPQVPSATHIPGEDWDGERRFHVEERSHVGYCQLGQHGASVRENTISSDGDWPTSSTKRRAAGMPWRCLPMEHGSPRVAWRTRLSSTI